MIKDGKFVIEIDLGTKLLWLSLFISLLVHLIVVVSSWRIQTFGPSQARNESIPVELVFDSKHLDAVDTLQETSKEAPVNPTFSSTRNLRTDEETSPLNSATNLVQIRGSQEDSNKTQNVGENKKEIFSLSQADLLDAGEVQRRGDSKIDSSGHDRRLQLGAELKVNAAQFDYGNYFLRMKRKLSQHWDIQKILDVSMYQYQEIAAEVAVILDDKGEIEQVYILSSSRFPAFDQNVVDLFNKAGPYPNPPRSLIQDDGKVYIPWVFYIRFNRFSAQRGLD